jgi:hypothetical protein
MGSADGAGDAWNVDPAYAIEDGVVIGFVLEFMLADFVGECCRFLTTAGEVLTYSC